MEISRVQDGADIDARGIFVKGAYRPTDIPALTEQDSYGKKVRRYSCNSEKG